MTQHINDLTPMESRVIHAMQNYFSIILAEFYAFQIDIFGAFKKKRIPFLMNKLNK